MRIGSEAEAGKLRVNRARLCWGKALAGDFAATAGWEQGLGAHGPSGWLCPPSGGSTEVEEKEDLSHRTHNKGPLPGDGWCWWDPNCSFPNVPLVAGSREKQERICTKTKQIS